MRYTPAELSSRDPRGGGGRLTLRRALAFLVLLAAVWLIASVRLSPGAAAAKPTPEPTSTACHGVACSSPTVPPSETPTTPPTPVPTATPTPPNATVRPTPYSEAIVNAPPTGTLPSTAGNLAVIPHSSGSGSPFLALGLVAMVVLGLMAATSFFFFFRIR